MLIYRQPKITDVRRGKNIPEIAITVFHKPCVHFLKLAPILLVWVGHPLSYKSSSNRELAPGRNGGADSLDIKPKPKIRERPMGGLVNLGLAHSRPLTHPIHARELRFLANGPQAAVAPGLTATTVAFTREPMREIFT